MTDIFRRCCITIPLLALLSLTAGVSRGQEPAKPGPAPTSVVHADAQVNPDLLLSLPNSDALITVDVKRLVSEGFPRLLTDEPTLRPLVMSLLLDLKTHIQIDPQAFTHVAVGLRIDNSEGGFTAVVIAQTSETTRLPALIDQRDYLEQQYAGKKLFIAKPAAAEPQVKFEEIPPETFAISTLNENTIVLGDVAYVRACLDINTTKANGIDPQQVTALKRNPKALLRGSKSAAAFSNLLRARGRQPAV